MNRKTIIAGFSLPALDFLWGIWLLIRGPQGSSFFATGVPQTVYVSLFGAFLAAIIVGVTLYLWKDRDLNWWQGFLISLGSMIIMVIVMMLLGGVGASSGPVAAPSPKV